MHVVRTTYLDLVSHHHIGLSTLTEHEPYQFEEEDSRRPILESGSGNGREGSHLSKKIVGVGT